MLDFTFAQSSFAGLPSRWTTLGPILVPTLAGLGALLVLFPRPKQPIPRVFGLLLGLFALISLGWSLLRLHLFHPEALLFYAFSGLALLGGGLLITQRNPARAALSFVLVVLSTCGLFLLLAAPFLMAATTIIYAGAIIVTFLFVLMLAQQEGPSDADQRTREPLLAGVAGFLLALSLLRLLQVSFGPVTDPELQGLVQQTSGLRERVQAVQKSLVDADEVKQKAEAILFRDNLLPKLDKLLGSPSADTESDFERWVNQHQAKQWKESEKAGRYAPDKLTQVNYALSNAKEAVSEVAVRPTDKERLSKLDHSLVDLQRQCQFLLNPQAVVRVQAEGLSTASGPSPDDPSQIRYDEHGRPHLPAENVAALGKSLFVDYLLPIELAGMLLLVATVGAIVISLRHSDKHQPGKGA